MEKKKKTKNITKKEIKAKKEKKKKSRAFTLIELLAVIIILGILMIIAIPSVTSYIVNSRKSAYIDTAEGLISGARTMVNQGKLGMYNTNATYFIPGKCVTTENVLKSPFGDFTETYIGVIYDGKGYKYYWISNDKAGQGIRNITLLANLDTELIESDVKDEEIRGTIEKTGIGTRSEIYILKDDCERWNDPITAVAYVSEEGGESTTVPTVPIAPNIVCIPATSLHKVTCTKTGNSGCNASGQAGNGNQITYGTIVSGSPKPGDAYDCKVTQTGGYTERFYYIGSEGANSILIYSKNMNDQAYYVYDSSNESWHGPRTAYQYLPSTSEWDNPGLIAPGTRQIVADNGGTVVKREMYVDGPVISKNIESFTYTNKAARMLTYQEVQAVCGSGSVYTAGYLDSCNWLSENLGNYEGNSGADGYWLETPDYYNQS